MESGISITFKQAVECSVRNVVGNPGIVNVAFSLFARLHNGRKKGNGGRLRGLGLC